MPKGEPQSETRDELIAFSSGAVILFVFSVWNALTWSSPPRGLEHLALSPITAGVAMIFGIRVVVLTAKGGKLLPLFCVTLIAAWFGMNLWLFPQPY